MCLSLTIETGIRGNGNCVTCGMGIAAWVLQYGDDIQ